MDDLLMLDRQHVWHPYAPMPGAIDPLLVTGAQGIRLELADGRRPIDAMASWWAAIHGYRHPVLDAAVVEQVGRMAHVMFGGLTHEPAIALARRLVELSPEGLEQVFFADSGSVSVEVALKMAVQFQRGIGAPQRTRIATLSGGYHGDTFGAMSVCDPVGGMHTMFSDILAQQVFLPRPPAAHGTGPDTGTDADTALAAWTTAAESVLDATAPELAAIIIEPVVQGAGGMHLYPPAVVAWLRARADELGILLIADEVATGFGRTGELFAVHHAGVTPDILCVGKALTGGYLSLAAVLCTPHVAAGIAASESGALMHGPTFMANPLACAVAAASLDLLMAGDWRSTVSRLGTGLEAGLSPARALPQVRDVRTMGGIGVIQLTRPVDVPRATAAALDHGVWVRPFRDLIYTMPPFICTDEDLAIITRGLMAAAEETA